MHNDYDGLPTTSHEIIIELRKKNPAIAIDQVGPRHIIAMIMQLDRNSLQIIFPGVPSAQELRRVSYAEIDELIAVIDGIDPLPSLDVPVAPSAEKIVHNRLPEYVGSILRQEEIAAARFRAYFGETSRAEIGNRVWSG